MRARSVSLLYNLQEVFGGAEARGSTIERLQRWRDRIDIEALGLDVINHREKLRPVVVEFSRNHRSTTGVAIVIQPEKANGQRGVGGHYFPLADTALSAALRAYSPAAGSPAHSSFQKLLEEAGARADLSSFFADWVDADKGLPDLSIAGVFPAFVSGEDWLVAVDLANSGYVQAEVPLTLRSGSGADARSITRRVRIPARGKATERILIQGKPTEVQLNDGAVPETQASVHMTRLD